MKVVIWKSPKYLRGILCRLFHITCAKQRQFLPLLFSYFTAGGHIVIQEQQ